MSLLPISLQFDESFFEGEWRCDHYVSPVMKKVWAVELDLLDQFIKFCEKYGITYYACSGTLLGAVRHGGFIPWDDDIDIVVTRKDFGKIEKYAPDYFKNPYFFQTERTDPGFSRHFARIRNSLTTAIAVDDVDCHIKTNQGIWIDIFPMDNIPDDPGEREKWVKDLNIIHNKMWRFSRMTLHYSLSLKKGGLANKMILMTGPVCKYICEKLHLKNPYYERYERLSKKYRNDETKMMGIPWFYQQFKEKLFFDKTWFKKSKTTQYENIRIVIPEKEDALLKHLYNDWHKLVKGTALHQTAIYDPEVSYMTYINDPGRLRKKIMESENKE